MVTSSNNTSFAKEMTAPVVSIIIPTTGNRSTLLARAIHSALAGMPPSTVEVLLIPNGPIDEWKNVLIDWQSHVSIKIHPITASSASAARNEGIRHASGTLVRFLDDDDFLLPNVAARQYNAMLSSNADISSYAIRIEDEDGRDMGLLLQPDGSDFVTSCLSLNRMQLPHAHVYRKELIQHVEWPIEIRWSEDVVWLHRVCRNGEIKWLRGDECVGIWYQHSAPRVSLMHAAHLPHAAIADSTIETIERLREIGQLDTSRLQAGVDALWACVHRGFYLRPLFWHRIAIIAMRFDPNSKPRLPPYNLSAFRLINPLFLEWIMLPKRALNHFARTLKGRLFGWNYVRKL